MQTSINHFDLLLKSFCTLIKMIDCPTIAQMKTIKEIRRENARALATEGPAEFARKLGMSTQQINQTVGPTPTRNIGDAIARRIEEAFGLPLGWLDVEHTSTQLEAARQRQMPGMITDLPKRSSNKLLKNIEPGPESKGRFPLISWVQAGTWDAIMNNFAPGDAQEWLDSPVELSENSYFVKVDGESMFDPDDHRSFREGEILAIDRGREPVHGSFVVVLLDGEEEATFRQLIIERGKRYLKALNPAWPNRIFGLGADDVIGGVVRSKVTVY